MATAPTGPPYPIQPSPEADGLAFFQVGVAGPITPFDYWNTIASQYANSTILTTIIGNIESYIDPTTNLESFFDLIWNIDTAQGYGLDVWGRIVGVNRSLALEIGAYFGFAESLPGALSFNFGATGSPLAGPFYSGEPLTNVYLLDDDAYRDLILAKAAANITNGSIPAINGILRSLFGTSQGNCYVQEGTGPALWFGFAESATALTFSQGVFYDGEILETMVMFYVFDFPLNPVQYAIATQSGVLPRSTGVAAHVVIQGVTVT
jgi:hypothetical protein